MNKLNINQEVVANCRHYSKKIAEDIHNLTKRYSTTSIERAVLRFYGIDGLNDKDIPLPNVLVDHIKDFGGLGRGASYWIGNACIALGKKPQEVAKQVSNGLDLSKIEKQDDKKVLEKINEFADSAIKNILLARKKREDMLNRLGEGKKPLLYLIVASGNIYEDSLQAKTAAIAGADIIAVIRSTAQSLLDYVPDGATTEGFGGTYATQENFRIMRRVLDEVSEKIGRYVRLVNYASGLCMPEICVMGSFERLDMMLNDAMYGILFRDINMIRTFIDQHFSRMINAVAGIIINTGEDNYLTTSDAVEEAHTVLTSQFINEQLALQALLPENQIGLGHAFEIDPDIEDGLLYEIANAQLVREIFSKEPIKYMPPTKFMNGNIFRGHIMDGMFNFVSILTKQHIHLLGMLTEAIHTPHLQDRYLAVENAKYVMNNARKLGDEIMFKEGGIIQARAQEVLEKTEKLLKDISKLGMIKTIEMGKFANITRQKDGGKGREGIFEKDENYYNPFFEKFEKVMKD